MKKTVFLILAAVILVLSSALPSQADGRGGHGGFVFRSSIWVGQDGGDLGVRIIMILIILISIPIMLNRLSLSRSRQQFMYSRTVSKRSRIIGISVQSHRDIIRMSRGAPVAG
jgi:hypothetical protein